MSEGSFVFNNQTTGGQVQINQGQTVTGSQVNNVGAVASASVEVIDKLAEAVPAEAREQMEEEVFGPLRDEISTLAVMPIAKAEEHKQSIVDRVASKVSLLAPYADKIQGVAVGFTEAALSAIAPPVGWIISATLAAVRALK